MSSPSPFNPKLVIGLIILGIAAFAALLLLLAFGQNIGAGRQGRATAVSVSAIGYKGLYDLAGRFHDVSLVRSQSDYFADNLVIVTLEDVSRREDVARLLQARAGRPTLLILPKWVVRPDPERRGWVQGLFAGAGSSAVAALGENIEVRVGRAAAGARAAGEEALAGLDLPVPASPQTIEGPGVNPLLRLGGAPAPALPLNPFVPSEVEGRIRGGEGGKVPTIAPSGPATSGKPGAAGSPSQGPALVARLGAEPHFVVADPDLLNNQAMRDPARARAALMLVEAINDDAAGGNSDIAFDLTVNGLGSDSNPSLLRTAFEPPFLAMTLALVVAAILAGLHGAFRFGPVRRARRAIAFGKAALVENSAGLIRLAGREANLGAAYADVVRHELARAVNAPAHLPPEAIDRWLDRIGPRDQPSFSELIRRLSVVGDRHALMAASRALIEWKRAVVK